MYGAHLPFTSLSTRSNLVEDGFHRLSNVWGRSLDVILFGSRDDLLEAFT